MTRPLLAAAAALLIMASPAAAQTSPLIAGYAPPGGAEQGTVAPATGDTGAVKGETVAPSLTNQSGSAPATAGAPKTTSAPSLATAPSATRTAATPSGSLPFTGLDVGMVALAGALLLGLGLLTRRFATRLDQTA